MKGIINDFEVSIDGVTIVVKQGSAQGPREASIQVTVGAKTLELSARAVSEYHDNNDQEYGVAKVAMSGSSGLSLREIVDDRGVVVIEEARDSMGGRHGIHHWGDQH